MVKNKLILNRDEIIKKIGKDYEGLSLIFSDKFGIINAMLERKELMEYDLFMYQCLSANTKDLFDLSREVSSGGLGIDETEKGAMISCLAEALERYCMSYIPRNDLKLSKLDLLDQDHCFNNFYTYSNNQYSNNKNFANPYYDEVYWTKIYSIKNKEDWKYWPASLIYLPFDLSNPVAENTSTGMAAGVSIENCIKSGLLELIERDALMINFLQRLNPPEIEIDSIKGINKKLLDTIRKKYDIKIYKLYSDVNVPIYLSLIWNKEQGKIHYGIGASASLDSDYAINKSLKECIFTHFYSKHIMKAKQEDAEQIVALYEHFLYYQGDKFNKLLFTSQVEKYVPQKVTFDSVIENLENNNISVYYKELTTTDIANTKIKVVKVVAPGLIDLNKSHLLPRLGANRFWEVPKKLNLSFKKELSKEPHPFP